jgi:hypothetical protein
VACFSIPKSDRQRTTFYQQSTTNSPSKNHVLHTRFCKITCKNGVNQPQKNYCKSVPSWDGLGPETGTRSSIQRTGNTKATKNYPQVPTSLQVVTVTVLPTGTTGNSGCAPGADYGIKVDITYQVLDQAGSAISKSGMKPLEVVQFAGGSPAGPNPIGPTDNSNSSTTTANNGTFHDVPFGLCSPSAITNATQLQIIYIDSVQQKVRQNAVTYNSSSSGHGSMSNGGDLNTSR